MFDKLTNQQVLSTLWQTQEFHKDYHKFTADALDNLMKEVFVSRSTDNISAIIITLDGLHSFYNQGLSNLNNAAGDHRATLNLLPEIEEIHFQPDRDEHDYHDLEQEVNQIDKNRLPKLPPKELNKLTQNITNE